MILNLLRRLADYTSALWDGTSTGLLENDQPKPEPAALAQVRQALEPSAAQKQRVWQRIESQIEPQRAAHMLTKVRDWLEPNADLQARIQLLMNARLSPAPAADGGIIFAKWSAAFLVTALLIKSSPLLFIAPHTVAATSVSLAATRGTVSLGDQGLLQPVTGELTLNAPGRIATGDGEATLALHSFGVVRLAPGTVFAIDDIGNHPTLPITGELTSGTAWIYGLLPLAVDGIRVATPAGTVTVNEGSASVSVQDGTVTIDAWDRPVRVSVGTERYLVQNAERLVLAADGEPRFSSLDPYSDDDWVSENAARDAVHRRELAQWQHEVRIANAGILPTSPLYAVKRAAEAVDLLLTFGSHSRAEKTLQLAETRLNEAAALLPESSPDTVATTSQVLRLAASGATVGEATVGESASGAIVRSLLDEYRTTILALAEESASGSGATASFVTDELAANSLQLAAALPTDVSYPLKQAVLATAAALPESNTEETSRETMLLDALTSLRTTLQAEPDSDLSAFSDLTPLLNELRSNVEENSAEVQREAGALEKTIATLARQRRTEVAMESTSRRGPTLPATIPHLSAAEIDQLVKGMLERIAIYRLPASRFNQLVSEMTSIAGHPDEGQILRRLDHGITEEPGLSARLRARMRQLKELRATESDQTGETGSGDTLEPTVDAA